MGTQEIQAPVFYAENAYVNLNEYLTRQPPSNIFIIVDSNTHNNCLARFLSKVETSENIEVVEMEPGEENKNIETCSGIWGVLSELGADRKSLIINLGGGVVTDLGGFVASTFRRGIPYINVPTTLLAMVDASVGGKTGVDLGNLKNQIGVITQPEMVLIDAEFLNTLSSAEMRSGLAEILKHGLISKRSYWDVATNLKEWKTGDIDEIIATSVDIKTKVVTEDPREENLRKTLNFGHTFGHAIESYLLSHKEKDKILHGDAVAAGMIIASYLSEKLTGLPKVDLEEITTNILELYPVLDLQEEEFGEVIDLLKFDKKNSHGNINFVLLKKIGEPVIDCKVPQELLYEALQFYKNLKFR